MQDFSQQPPAQELIARDLHGNEWKFRHIFRGELQSWVSCSLIANVGIFLSVWDFYVSFLFTMFEIVFYFFSLVGQPKRHLLTTGWSVFVAAKRLVVGDSMLFIWQVILLFPSPQSGMLLYSGQH